jgi:anthranilate synthase component 1
MTPTEQTLPPRDHFERRHGGGEAQLVFRRVAGDLDTPVSAYLKLRAGGRDSFLLESVEGGDMLGRYTTIGVAPDLVWRARGGQAEIARAPGFSFEADDLDVLASLHGLIDAGRIPPDPAYHHLLPPMAAGLFGYFGYDFVRLTERLPNRPPSPYEGPDGYFVRPTVLVIFDNVRRDVILVTPARDLETAPGVAYDAACARLDAVAAALAAPLPGEPDAVTVSDFASNLTPAEYRARVEQAREYIAAGDIFQVVLSQRFSAEFAGDPLQVYRQLRRINPSPFLFLLDFAPMTLLGASPEILVRIRDGEVTIRPIAGTRPRGATAEEDLALERELLADPKERAEHLMLLDLGRNDVGRSAALGTVKADPTFAIERYSHVMHIVSNVTGRLAADCSPLQALANGFPAGTLTGAPKVRAMEIIDELEPEGRGPYAGCIGYFGSDGSVDTCIALRMATVERGRIHVQAGAGIVLDSDPEAEQRECEAKAAAVIAAVRAAAG